MKRKKLLSTVVAGMLVAAQMVMPVMAADGGKVDVDVTTTDVVIRVKVPTTLSIAVNQFEKDDAGSQITSENFTIENMSEIPVKVAVTTTVELNSDADKAIGLVTKKADVATSTAVKGEAWLAVAAMVEDGKYVTDATSSDTKIGTLTEASANVATFAKVNESGHPYDGKIAAEQVFYLAKGTGTPTYKAVTIKDATGDTTGATLKAAQEITYARFYKVTEMTTTTTPAAPTDLDELKALVKEQDIVVIDGTTVTVIKKGDNVTALPSGNPTYYTIDGSPKKSSELTVPASGEEIYIYGEATTATTGGKAGFRMIGKLSEKKETWDATDIPKVHINYDIKGVTDTRYGEVTANNGCTYGLYTGSGSGSSTVTEVNGVRVTNGSGSTTYSTGADVANRLKSGAVQFVLDSSTATTVKTGSIAVTKIEIDGTEYTPTGAPNSSANADSDGKTYSVTGFTASSVTTIKVFYGTDLVVKYTF